LPAFWRYRSDPSVGDLGEVGKVTDAASSAPTT
jgi:hypothetical protein